MRKTATLGITGVMRPSLADLPFLRGASKRALKSAESASEWFSVPGGWSLFQAGDPADAAYFVVSGALVVHQPSPDGQDDIIGHIRAGEPVGEMALIAGDVHSASVSALRDTEVIALKRADFQKLVRAYPEFMQSLSRLMLMRARETRHGRVRSEPRMFALFSTSPSIDIDGFARRIARHIEALGRKCAIVGEEAEDRPSAFFDELERDNDIVMLVAPMNESAWFRICLRQADRMWVVARRDARPSTPMPLSPDDNSPARRFRLVDVIILEEGGPTACDPRLWLDAVAGVRLFRWRGDADSRRLARTLCAVSVGVVLSGGGARAYAHVGAVRAFREAGLPIDFVGGASMGGIVAAGVAMGWNDDEIEARIRDAFVMSNPIADFTLPVVALTTGRRVDARLKEHFGEARIEELSLPFFAVSSNLTDGTAHVHRSGLLREALRASIALPGILPPVVVGDDVLVDGAVINNFPVNIMHAFHRGPTLGVDVARQRTLIADDFRAPKNFFSWVLEHGLSEPPPIASLLMRTATVHVNPWSNRENVDLLVAPELQDVEIRDWRRFDAAVDAGYWAARRELENPPARVASAIAAAKALSD